MGHFYSQVVSLRPCASVLTPVGKFSPQGLKLNLVVRGGEGSEMSVLGAFHRKKGHA